MTMGSIEPMDNCSGTLCSGACAVGCAGGCLVGGGTTIAFGALGGTAGGSLTAYSNNA
ncbi:hypothetical protein [Paenibacillus oralis]|uniref:hypothetical protein n=1 Tax=Paenibacillus oralis TaxID=2490856 RepID=UPI0015AC9CB7|nr:hypothetical protein [Paenibacillus oralis]